MRSMSIGGSYAAYTNNEQIGNYRFGVSISIQIKEVFRQTITIQVSANAYCPDSSSATALYGAKYVKLTSADETTSTIYFAATSSTLRSGAPLFKTTETVPLYYDENGEKAYFNLSCKFAVGQRTGHNCIYEEDIELDRFSYPIYVDGHQMQYLYYNGEKITSSNFYVNGRG